MNVIVVWMCATVRPEAFTTAPRGSIEDDVFNADGRGILHEPHDDGITEIITGPASTYVQASPNSNHATGWVTIRTRNNFVPTRLRWEEQVDGTTF